MKKQRSATKPWLIVGLLQCLSLVTSQMSTLTTEMQWYLLSDCGVEGNLYGMVYLNSGTIIYYTQNITCISLMPGVILYRQSASFDIIIRSFMCQSYRNVYLFYCRMRLSATKTLCINLISSTRLNYDMKTPFALLTIVKWIHWLPIVFPHKRPMIRSVGQTSSRSGGYLKFHNAHVTPV